METPNSRLRSSPLATLRAPLETSELSSPTLEDPDPDQVSTSSPHQISSPGSLPDQNSNSVRDLENAMTKHLPKRKAGGDGNGSVGGDEGPLPLPLPPTTSLEATSSLIKQFYSRQAGGYLDLDAENQFLNYVRLGYPPAPTQPLPLKPNVYAAAASMGSGAGAAGSLEPSAAYTAGFHDPGGLYANTPTFALHNRGQWYPTN